LSTVKGSDVVDHLVVEPVDASFITFFQIF